MWFILEKTYSILRYLDNFQFEHHLWRQCTLNRKHFTRNDKKSRRNLLFVDIHFFITKPKLSAKFLSFRLFTKCKYLRSLPDAAMKWYKYQETYLNQTIQLCLFRCKLHERTKINNNEACQLEHSEHICSDKIKFDLPNAFEEEACRTSCEEIRFLSFDDVSLHFARCTENKTKIWEDWNVNNAFALFICLTKKNKKEKKTFLIVIPKWTMVNVLDFFRYLFYWIRFKSRVRVFFLHLFLQ